MKSLEINNSINRKRIEIKTENLALLLKEKEQEARIAKQKAGFFARKHAEVLTKLEQEVKKGRR